LSTQGGFWTPGALMPEVLVKRLRQHAGISFAVDA
jgi:short subunit dehydrogenase-like uncharacterized protein